MASEDKEMTGLWARGCFKKWHRNDLLKTDRVFGSRFHCNIKRDAATGLITNCKVRLVVLGNRMEEEIDYEDSFSPVPHAVASRIIMSIAAAADMELHCVDLSQAFIQADKIEEGMNGSFFIMPPVGYNEEPGVVY
eukprot:844474-Rhodomonas_salina.2